MRKWFLILLVVFFVGCSSEEAYHSRDWDGDDARCLAQLASYTAWDKNFESKILIINIAVNRVWSEDYPNKIEAVVDEMTDGMYKYEVPDYDCWDAEYHVQVDGWDVSNGNTEYAVESGQIVTKEFHTIGIAILVVGILILLLVVAVLLIVGASLWRTDE